MHVEERKQFVKDLKRRWRILWRDRIDDKVRAEGIASQDYPLLFVDRGEVIVATKGFKPLDFREIRERHKPANVNDAVPPNPSVGGWGKFIRSVLREQRRFTRRGRPLPPKPDRGKNPQLKRGWLHFRMRRK